MKTLKEKVLKVSSQGAFESFLSEEIMPKVKDFGLNLTKKELLDYEKEALQKLESTDLSEISGGVSHKSVLSGLMAMCSGIIK